jgi:hypothetical protein
MNALYNQRSGTGALKKICFREGPDNVFINRIISIFADDFV